MSLLEDELGDIISKARRGLGLTTDQLAREVGIAPAEIAAIESYRTKPDSSTIDALASALRLNAAKLGVIAAESWSPRVIMPSAPVAVERVCVPFGSYSANCYVAACPKTGSAVIVDPGGAISEIVFQLTTHNWRLAYILITHAHSDHTGALSQLLTHYPSAIVAISQIEHDSVMRGLTSRWEPAQDNLHIPLGNLKITPLLTPGHTPGSTCYLVGDVCFTGDTLFAGSIGRPANQQVYESMLTAIRAHILSRPDNTIILPGHGPATTVAEEKSHNPFF